MSDTPEVKSQKYVSVSKEGTDIRVSIGEGTTTDEVLGLLLSGLVHSIGSQFVSVGQRQILEAVHKLSPPPRENDLVSKLSSLVSDYYKPTSEV